MRMTSREQAKNWMRDSPSKVCVVSGYLHIPAVLPYKIAMTTMLVTFPFPIVVILNIRAPLQVHEAMIMCTIPREQAKKLDERQPTKCATFIMTSCIKS